MKKKNQLSCVYKGVTYRMTFTSASISVTIDGKQIGGVNPWKKVPAPVYNTLSGICQLVEFPDGNKPSYKDA